MKISLCIKKAAAVIAAIALTVSSAACSGSHTEKERNLSCTFSISCKAAYDNIGSLAEEKREFVSESGWLFEPCEVKYADDESVFDILKRVCAENSILIEYTSTALGSVYVEGINQLYEFDMGSESGWIYTVNGDFAVKGASEYIPAQGDTISWEYTVRQTYFSD